MKVTELNRDQLIELKNDYLVELVNEGIFAEILEVDHDEPSYGDLENVDELIPDDVIFSYFEGVNFIEDDFEPTEIR